jgi:SpoVK/Ycf46/Vps4 family AAA+-type ATPase
MPVFAKKIAERDITAGIIIDFFNESFEQGLSFRRYFASYSNLIANGLILLKKDYGSSNLPDFKVLIEEHVLNYIVGDKNVYSTNESSMNTENPVTKFENVILDETLKTQIRDILYNHKKYFENIKKYRLTEIIDYGTALSMLFYGPSGTGKTMMARAVANYLQKPMVTLNVGKNPEIGYFDLPISAIEEVFRRARMMDAVLFLDECDKLTKHAYFKRELLVEIEKAAGIVIFATNKGKALPEAIDRRLLLKVNFGIPGYELRRKIWDIHFPEKSLLSKDFNFDALAKKYVLTGGQIKNCVLRAISQNTGKNNGDLIITQEDIENSARNILDEALHVINYSNIYNPRVTLDELNLNDEEKPKTAALIETINKTNDSKKRIMALFCCPEEQRIIAIAEGIAERLNLPVNVLPADLFYNEKSAYFLNYGDGAGYSEFIQIVSKELKRENSILVITDSHCELFEKNQEKKSNPKALFSILERIDKNVLFIYPSKLHGKKDLLKQFDCVLTFENYSAEEREKIWKEQLDGIGLEDAVDLARLSGDYCITGEQIGRAVNRLRMGYYLNGCKKLSMDDVIKQTGEILREDETSPILFGGEIK